MIAGAERRRLLARMGIAVFVPRRAPVPSYAEPRATKPAEGGAPAEVAAAGGEPAVARLARRPAEVSGPAPPAAGDAAAGEASHPIGSRPDGATPVGALDWTELEAAVAGCVACPLHRERRRTVFGTGARAADWLVVGEAPGANEDRQGEPFVGRAGRLLDAMLHAIGLAREEVFITNTVKCRPPGNRDPHPEETERCGPFLDRQIELLGPRIIVVAGRIAAQTILDTDAPIARLRGREHSVSRAGRRVPVVATYHPAYLLRRPIAKRAAWEDLCLARSIADRSR